MPKTARDVPPPLELLCLKALWSIQEGNVKDVQRIVAASRPLAYTTVMTIMHRLYLKGFLLRNLRSKTHFYEPAIAFADVRDAAVGGIIDHFFEGSREQFLHFLESETESSEEVNSPASLDETLL